MMSSESEASLCKIRYVLKIKKKIGDRKATAIYCPWFKKQVGSPKGILIFQKSSFF